MAVNSFFKTSDPRTDNVGGYAIDPSWWSRVYEYPWAIQYAVKGGAMADMGCGWWPRPFKEALADIGMTYAVDANEKVLELPEPKFLLKHVHADFTMEIPNMHDLDVVFCISVLEDLGPQAVEALTVFRDMIHENGKIVVTFDVPYDDDKPTPHYPGLALGMFGEAVDRAGLQFTGDCDDSKTDAVVHTGFNLCVYHAVLERYQ